MLSTSNFIDVAIDYLRGLLYNGALSRMIKQRSA